ncbi:MAG: Imm8 family immunity protein [Candidatus Xenobia bacterium]
MKAVVKYIGSHELDRTALPDDPEDCWVIVTAEVGEAGDEAADNFQFTVVTVRALERAVTQSPFFVLGRHLIVVRAFDWQIVESAIRRAVERAQGRTWEELAGRIGRHGAWEYEDYNEPVPREE